MTTTKANEYWRLFKSKCCSIRLEGTSKEEVFKELLELLVEGGDLDAKKKDAAFEALVERERLASTGVGQGVAVPHVKLAGLDRVVVSFSVHPGGLDWDAVDGAPVHLFFTILRPAEAGEHHDPDAHRTMMQWISSLCRDADFRSFALQAKSKAELNSLLKEMAGK